MRRRKLCYQINVRSRYSLIPQCFNCTEHYFVCFVFQNYQRIFKFTCFTGCNYVRFTWLQSPTIVKKCGLHRCCAITKYESQTTTNQATDHHEGVLWTELRRHAQRAPHWAAAALGLCHTLDLDFGIPRSTHIYQPWLPPLKNARWWWHKGRALYLLFGVVPFQAYRVRSQHGTTNEGTNVLYAHSLIHMNNNQHTFHSRSICIEHIGYVLICESIAGTRHAKQKLLEQHVYCRWLWKCGTGIEWPTLLRLV